MTKNVCKVLGIKNVELYMKGNEYFLKVTYDARESNGNVFRYVTDGIKLGIYHGDDVMLKFDKPDIFIHNVSLDIPNSYNPCGIKFGFHSDYELSRDSATTKECIERNVKRCTIEELERELGCRLEIVSEED